MTARRIAVVRVGSELFARFMSHPMSELTSDWPPDGTVVGCDWDNDRRTVRLFVESETFDPVEEGYIAPDFEPVFHVRWMAPEIVEVIEAFRAEKH